MVARQSLTLGRVPRGEDVGPYCTSLRGVLESGTCQARDHCLRTRVSGCSGRMRPLQNFIQGRLATSLSSGKNRRQEKQLLCRADCCLNTAGVAATPLQCCCSGRVAGWDRIWGEAEVPIQRFEVHLVRGGRLTMVSSRHCFRSGNSFLLSLFLSFCPPVHHSTPPPLSLPSPPSLSPPSLSPPPTPL